MLPFIDCKEMNAKFLMLPMVQIHEDLESWRVHFTTPTIQCLGEWVRNERWIVQFPSPNYTLHCISGEDLWIRGPQLFMKVS